jgi:predicted nucleic acid-binding protein
VILIDTTPLVALCDARDPYHAQAVDDLQALAGSSLATCEPVVVEACFHLPHRMQRLRLGALLDRLDVAAVPAAPDRRYRRQVFDWLARYAEHEPDWAGACLCVLSSHLAAARIWTYDREFVTTWRRMDGTPIPLVGKK